MTLASYLLRNANQERIVFKLDDPNVVYSPYVLCPISKDSNFRICFYIFHNPTNSIEFRRIHLLFIKLYFAITHNEYRLTERIHMCDNRYENKLIEKCGNSIWKLRVKLITHH